MNISIALPSIVQIPYIFMCYCNHNVSFLNFSLGNTIREKQINIVKPDILITSKKLCHLKNLSCKGCKKVIYIDTVAGYIHVIIMVMIGRFRIQTNQKDIFLRSGFILFTSGSTGDPKAVYHKVSDVKKNIYGRLEILNIPSGKRFLNCLPFFHSFGTNTGLIFHLLCLFNLGVPSTKFYYFPYITNSLAMGKFIKKHKITDIGITPFFLEMIVTLNNNEDLSTLENLYVGGDFSTKRLVDICKKNIPKCSFHAGYGMTECFPIISISKESYSETNGTILPHINFILQNGETYTTVGIGMLCITLEDTCKQYISHPLETIQYNHKEYFVTHDIVSVNKNRQITLISRDERIIKIGGELINTQIIQKCLTDSDNYSDCIVVGKKNTIYCFSIKKHTRELINEYIISSGFSTLYCIKQVIIIDSVPYKGIGKVDYKQLQAMI